MSRMAIKTLNGFLVSEVESLSCFSTITCVNCQKSTLARSSPSAVGLQEDLTFSFLILDATDWGSGMPI